MTPFTTWFRHAKRRSRLLYYTGYLAADRGPESKDSRTEQQETVHRLAVETLRYAIRGEVALTQKKLSPGVYAYYAERL